MAFSPRPDRGRSGHGYLDLTGDREVVYCHACSHEWYNDEYGLQCPHCESQICEIITPDNDPREEEDELHFPRGHNHAHGFDHNHNGEHDHPDPDEDDIGAVLPGVFSSPPSDPNHPNQDRPVDPNSSNEIFNRFQETLHMIGIFPSPGQAGRPDPESPPFGPSRFGPPGGSSQTRTYSTPFSITTSIMVPRPEMRGGDLSGDQDHNRNFDIIFGNFMGGGRVQAADVAHGPFEGHVGNFLSLLLGGGGPNAVHGDAVYSQEALDRIISQMMEANPQSNAAPPATEDAIQELEKKKLNKEMMGESDKVECTICIDETRIGDEVTVLPCKHWFHGECVVLWLKEHNTCPICRNPIEKRNDNNEDSGHAGGGSSARTGTFPGGQAGAPLFGGWYGGGIGNNNFPGESTDSSPAGGSAGPSDAYHQARAGRSPEERQARLNAIRNLAGPASYGQQAAPESPSSSRYRRDSWSPTSPPPGASSARMRSPPRPRHDRENSGAWGSQRSSTNNSSSGNNNSGNNGGSSNPINWFRDRFSGGSGSGNGSGSSSNNGPGRRRS